MVNQTFEWQWNDESDMPEEVKINSPVALHKFYYSVTESKIQSEYLFFRCREITLVQKKLISLPFLVLISKTVFTEILFQKTVCFEKKRFIKNGPLFFLKKPCFKKNVVFSDKRVFKKNVSV